MPTDLEYALLSANSYAESALDVSPNNEIRLSCGMVEGVVQHVSADATEAPSATTRSDALGGRDRPMGPLAYRALVELKRQDLAVGGARYALSPGMQVSSEINLGTRTILDYVLSPVQKAWHEAGRER
jgi:HlyD family secretion protein